MFEAAETGRRVSAAVMKKRSPDLRRRLLHAQTRLSEADFPVLIVFGGVDGAGKGELANCLSAWMDPRWIITRAYDDPTKEEAGRPPHWRFWRDLPPHGHTGVFLRAWYHDALVDRVYGTIDDSEFEARTRRITAFERTLVDDGALILKFWLHLGRRQQKERFKRLEADPLHS